MAARLVRGSRLWLAVCLIVMVFRVGQCPISEAETIYEQLLKLKALFEGESFKELMHTLDQTEGTLESFDARERRIMRMAEDFAVLMRSDENTSGECITSFWDLLVSILKRLSLQLAEETVKQWNSGGAIVKLLIIIFWSYAIVSIQSALYILVSGLYQSVPKIISGIRLTLDRINEQTNIAAGVDNIKVYEELSNLSRNRHEELSAFIRRFVARWKASSPKLSRHRTLSIMAKHLPREFLIGLTDLDPEEASVQTVLDRWNNYMKWVGMADSQSPVQSQLATSSSKN